MTIYNWTVTFQDIERIAVENMVSEAIREFKEKYPNGELPVPWVWESILEKFKRADISLLSGNNFAEWGNTIFINLPEDK